MFGKKIISGIVTFATMLFSSFQGNSASFSDLNVSYRSNQLEIETSLLSAFENDFENIFKSGEEIRVWYDLEVKKSKRIVFENQFYHSVKYDPLEGIYELYLSEKEESIYLDTYEKLKYQLSLIKYAVPIDNVKKNDNLDVKIKSSLRKIRLPQMEKEFDLMMLWHNKQPSKRQTYQIKSYEA